MNTQDDAFNLEKETKIINPHKMDSGTTAAANFQPFVPEVKFKKVKKKDLEITSIQSEQMKEKIKKVQQKHKSVAVVAASETMKPLSMASLGQGKKKGGGE